MIGKWKGLIIILIGAFALWMPQLMYAQGAYVAASRIPVLMYHEVVELGPATSAMNQYISINPKKFEYQMKFLASRGYKTEFMRDYAEQVRANAVVPRNTVVLTFDDGTVDFYENVMPVLRAYNLRATLYANPGFDGLNDRMTHSQLQEVAQSGLVEIAAHTMTHQNLTQISNEDARAEILESKNLLEQLTGVPVISFAYPFGEYTPTIAAMVRDLGFSSATIASEAPSKFEDSLYAWPRRMISEVDTFNSFVKKIDP